MNCIHQNRKRSATRMRFIPRFNLQRERIYQDLLAMKITLNTHYTDDIVLITDSEGKLKALLDKQVKENERKKRIDC